MTLMEMHNSDGLVGRCDAKCYEATHPDCDCICGGMNHGAGRQKALDNTREHLKSMIEKYAEEKGLKDFETLIGFEVLQNKLF